MKNYCVIGKDVSNSLSPKLQTELARRIGVDVSYTTKNLKKENLKDFCGFARENLDGFNVTTPFKEEIVKYLDEVKEYGKALSAVSAVKVANGRLIGDNYDVFGIGSQVKYLCGSTDSFDVLILGGGGGARSAAYALCGKTKSIDILNRTVEKAASIIKDYKLLGKALYKLDKKYDLIINCTTLGGYEDVGVSPLSREAISGASYLIDMLYYPRETEIMKLARSERVKCENGIPMLCYQAVASLEFFHGVKVPISHAKEMIEIL